MYPVLELSKQRSVCPLLTSAISGAKVANRHHKSKLFHQKKCPKSGLFLCTFDNEADTFLTTSMADDFNLAEAYSGHFF
jgi:hypothetical protein